MPSQVCNLLVVLAASSAATAAALGKDVHLSDHTALKQNIGDKEIHVPGMHPLMRKTSHSADARTILSSGLISGSSRLMRKHSKPGEGAADEAAGIAKIVAEKAEKAKKAA